MDAQSEDAWFYSHEGETYGPVPFGELVAEAKGKRLNRRLDLVWRHGMTDWVAAGEIEGLFEKPILPPPDLSLVAHKNPQLTPKERAALSPKNQNIAYPGARRRSFYFMIFIFPVLWSIGLEYGKPFMTQQFGEQMMNQLMLGLPFLPMLLGLYFVVRRLINVGMSGWWFLVGLIPLVNLWVGYRVFVCPGGYAYSKKLDGAGVFLAILYWLFVVALVGTVAGLVAVSFGIIGTPEQQEQLQEILRKYKEMLPAAPAK
jgi:uncharacterized membrane protein YhaH (DUF805 family)